MEQLVHRHQLRNIPYLVRTEIAMLKCRYGSRARPDIILTLTLTLTPTPTLTLTITLTLTPT